MWLTLAALCQGSGFCVATQIAVFGGASARVRSVEIGGWLEYVPVKSAFKIGRDEGRHYG